MQGQQRAQCEWSDQTIIFEYHPTPVMDVQMPNDMKSCETRSLQMVLSQGKNYSAVVKVSENYGYAGNDEANPREVCHNRPGSIKIEDSISHRHHSCHPQNPRGSTSCSVPLRVFPQGCTLTACTTSEATIPILTGSPNYVDVAGNFSRPYVATVEGTTITKTFRATILGHTAVGDKFSMSCPVSFQLLFFAIHQDQLLIPFMKSQRHRQLASPCLLEVPNQSQDHWPQVLVLESRWKHALVLVQWYVQKLLVSIWK